MVLRKTRTKNLLLLQSILIEPPSHTHLAQPWWWVHEECMVWRKELLLKVQAACSMGQHHRNKKCIEVATEEFLKGRLVLLLEIERPLSVSHVFSKQSVFYFIKLSALFFSPLMLYFIFNPSLLFLPVFAGEISLCHVFLFLTVFCLLHGEQCCTYYTIHISMASTFT